MAKWQWFDTATGTVARNAPSGAKREDLLRTIRLGLKFRIQQDAGKRPEFLHRYLVGIVSRVGSSITFEALLDELALEGAQRNQAEAGEATSPVEQVDRVWGLVTYHDPKRGRLQVAFGTLRNKFTAAKKAAFTDSPKP